MPKTSKNLPRIRFLSIKDIEYVHTCQLKDFGGLDGIRDHNLLASAVHEPKATFGGSYLYEDFYDMAAAYALGIIKNHPFVDGNKRTGMESAILFLRANNVSLSFKRNDIFKLGLAIATSKKNINDIAAVFRKKSYS